MDPRARTLPTPRASCPFPWGIADLAPAGVALWAHTHLVGITRTPAPAEWRVAVCDRCRTARTLAPAIGSAE